MCIRKFIEKISDVKLEVESEEKWWQEEKRTVFFQVGVLRKETYPVIGYSLGILDVHDSSRVFVSAEFFHVESNANRDAFQVDRRWRIVVGRQKSSPG